MSRRRGIVGLGMEDMDESVEGDLAETQAAAASADNESSEIQEDVIDESVGIEEASDAIDELEDYQEIAQDAVDSGEGLSEDGAAVLTVGAESICRRLGFPPLHRPIPSVESFGSKQSRVQATKIAIEGISDTIKKVWEAIKAAIQRIWDKIRSFFNGLTGNAEKARAHLQELKKRVDAMNSSGKKKNNTLEDKSLAKLFSQKGKAGKAEAELCVANAITAMSSLPTITKVVLSASSQLAIVSGEIATDPAKATSKIEDLAKMAADGLAGVVRGLKPATIPSLEASLKGKAPKRYKNNNAAVYGPFVGCRALVLITSSEKMKGDVEVGGTFAMSANETDNIITDKVNKISIRFEEVDDEKYAAEKIEALERADMLSLLNKGIDLAGKIYNTKNEGKNSEEALKNMKSCSEKMVALAGKIEGVSLEQKDAIRDMKDETNEFMSMISGVSSAIPSISIKTVTAVGLYVSACLNNLEKEKD